MSEQVETGIFSVRERQCLIVTGVIAFTLGVHGYHEYFSSINQSATILDAAYHAINLFLMQFIAKEQLPWSLEVARWLAPLTLSYTLIKTILVFAKDSVVALKLRKLSEHGIVLGLNKGSFELACSMASRGIKPVVVDHDDKNEYLGPLSKQKIHFLAANPADPTLLDKLNAASAKYLFAATESDTTNLEIIHNASGKKRPFALNAVCRINNQSLIRTLYNRPLFAVNHDNIYTKIINGRRITARWLMSEYGPDCLVADIAKRDCIKIGIIGDTTLTAAMTTRLAEVGIYGANTLLQITVLGINNATELHSEIKKLQQNDAMNGLIELNIKTIAEPTTDELEAQLVVHELDCCYIAMQESDYALMALQSLLDISAQCPLVVTEVENAETFEWLSSEFTDVDRIHFAATHKVSNSFVSVFGEAHDLLAKRIHEQYVAEQKAAGSTVKDNTSLVSWDALPETLKDANRNQADHITTKCRLITGEAIPTPVEFQNALTVENIEILAQTEHKRWMAEKFLAGWRFTEGEKDASKRLSPSLKPWQELPESEKQKDRDAILHIPNLLTQVTQQSNER